VRAHSDVDRIVQALPALPERGDEFRYASVPLCVLDAVFSIGVRYESVQALIQRYADHYGLPLHRARAALPSERDQATVSVLTKAARAVGPPASVGAVDYAIWQHERQQRVTVR
jgi:hypothetical protein